MAFAGLLISFARAIFVVLNEGHVIDAIVHGLAPGGLLPIFSAVGMMIADRNSCAGSERERSSGANNAVLIPTFRLLHLPRQVTVLAYQYGAGLCELILQRTL